MTFTIEDYTIHLSKPFHGDYIEIEITKGDRWITFSYSVHFLEVSEAIKQMIKDNELKEYGYCRMPL